METCSSETSVDFQQTTRRDIPEDTTIRVEDYVILIIYEVYCGAENPVF
jgi:hypothetical protein